MKSENFHCIFLRSIFFIPQSATFTPFFTPIPATSHFSLFVFSPEKTKSKAFSISIVTRNPFLFKILVVSSTLYISLPLSLIYLFFTYADWLDEIRSGNMSFNHVVHAFEINFRSVFRSPVLYKSFVSVFSFQLILQLPEQISTHNSAQSFGQFGKWLSVRLRTKWLWV